MKSELLSSANFSKGSKRCVTYTMKCTNVNIARFMILGVFLIRVGVELYSDLRCEKFFS